MISCVPKHAGYLLILYVINIEWGNFCSSHLPLTKYDQAIDAKSLLILLSNFVNCGIDFC